MKKFILFLLFLFISNCTLKKVEKHHGVHFLEKKQEKLVLVDSNKNDIVKLLGPPSTKSTFDNDVWIYIERKLTKRSSILKFGKDELTTNNVLILEIDTRGQLVKKDFYDIESMKSLDFSESSTEMAYSKGSFVYKFLSSLRQKINDPLGKRQEGVAKKKKQF